MVTRGKIRGNGAQLATYLLRKADNDNVFVFDIRGTCQPDNLHRSLLEMSLTSELTKTDNGLYHAQLSPSHEDRELTKDEWLRSAEILEEELGLSGQKRIMVMHIKGGFSHMHLSWERYDHDKGIMRINDFSRYAQDRARIRMEKEFNLIRTPERNERRPEMRQFLTELWLATDNAETFIKAAKDKGYVMATGTQRPYMVIDDTGRSFDLVRELDGIKTKEVRERFKTTKLVKEKEAIATQQKQKIIVLQKEKDKQPSQTKKKEVAKQKVPESRKALKAVLNDNIAEITSANDNRKTAKQAYGMKASFMISSNDAIKSEEQLRSAIAKQDEKEAKRKEILDKLNEERLQRARVFLENKKDMER